ncbi:MAG TPA: hypothetical protein VFZ68_14055 [Acidimicrobiales bacterium]
MRRALALTAALACALGIFLVREATISRHAPTDPASHTDVVVRARARSDAVDLPAATEALVGICLFEARTRQVDRTVSQLDEQTWSFRIRPALDEGDERQLHGCLEDARVDHYQAEVLDIVRR